MKHLFFTIALGMFVSTFAQKKIDDVLQVLNSGSIPYISVTEARMHQINSDALILDARESGEYEVSHIPDARFVGYSDFNIEAIPNHILDKDRLIIVYCSLGVRSENIGEELQEAGYSNVKNLYGGIIEWKNKGFPLLNSYGSETENVHTYSRYWGKWLTNGNPVYE